MSPTAGRCAHWPVRPGSRTLPFEWARWVSLKPLSGRCVGQEQPRAELGANSQDPPNGIGRSASAQEARLRDTEALDRILAEIAGWNGADSPWRARYPWAAMPMMVDDEIGRARSLGFELALVLWEVATRPAAMTEAVWIASLHHLAGRIGQNLPAGSLFFHDETGRFVVLLARASDAKAREYVKAMEPVLTCDSLVTRLFGEDRLVLRTKIASYPAPGETAEAVLGRLDASIAAAIGKIDEYATRSA